VPILRKSLALQRALVFQWLPRRLVDAHQLHALRRMLAHAEKKVPLYRERFRQAGVSAADLRTLGDLCHFPIISREDVVAGYPDGILSRSPRPDDVVFRTSGTSGRFMQIAYDARGNDQLDAVYMRALLSAGYRPWHRMAYFWYEQHKQPQLHERLGLFRKTFMTIDPDPRQQVTALRQLRPHYIYHFPSSLNMIARIMEADGIRDLRPLGVISQGEYMAPEIQQHISHVFGCPVWNQYGAQEFNRLGWNCDRFEGLHLDADSAVLEVLDGERPVDVGQEGDLVFTGLLNPLMPLIRYRIGDMGRLLPGACSCRRGLPLFEITEGRRDDVLVFPDGRRIGPRVLAPRIEELPGFSLYRVVHKRPDHIEVLVVKEANAPADLDQSLIGAVSTVVGERVTVVVKAVEDIPLSSRGKLRKIISEARGGTADSPAADAVGRS
jgi:phenylacetate-CoA ligase